MSIFNLSAAIVSPTSTAIARSCAVLRLNQVCPVSKTHRSCIHDVE